MEQHQIKPICNARSGNQTRTLSPLRHPCPPPGEIPSDVSFPPPPLAPGNNLPNNLRILPTDVTLKHHAPDVNLNATSGHYLLDFFPGLNPPDIPHGHSTRTFPPTDSFPSLTDIVNLFVCLLVFFFTVFLGIYKGFTARRHKNLQELYKGTLGMTCLFYSFIH